MSSRREAVIRGSSCRTEPAAALRGLANSGSPPAAPALFRPPESPPRHVHVPPPPHLEAGREVIRPQLHGDAADGAQVFCDVLSPQAIAAGGPLHEAPVL